MRIPIAGPPALLVFGVPLLLLGGAAALAGASTTVLALGLAVAALDTSSQKTFSMCKVKGLFDDARRYR
jgi:hypothetical protein